MGERREVYYFAQAELSFSVVFFIHLSRIQFLRVNITSNLKKIKKNNKMLSKKIIILFVIYLQCYSENIFFFAVFLYVVLKYTSFYELSYFIHKYTRSRTSTNIYFVEKSISTKL